MSDTTPRPDEPRPEDTPEPAPEAESAADTTPDAGTGAVPPAQPDAAPPEAPGYEQPAYAQQAYADQQYAQQQYAPQPYAPTAGPPMSAADERTTGMAAHGVALAATVVSAGLLSFVAALVMYLVFKDRGPFVRHHTANALNVQIIVGIAFLISIPLMFIVIGIFTFAAAWVFAVVVHVIGMIKANNGEWWDPPLTPKFVS